MNSSLTDLREIRRFGLIGIVFFSLTASIALWRSWSGFLIVFCIFLTCCVLFAAVPGQMAPLYTRWIKIAKVIGVINTGIVLTLTYYLVVTPVALARRIFVSTPPIASRPDPEQVSVYLLPASLLQ
jgi:cell division protein FtsW (lipid II flippase)